MIAVPSHIASLKPYQPGKSIAEVERELGISGSIKLASNENPLGTSPKALEAIVNSLQDLPYYPDAGRALRYALADRFVIKPENVICGSGSESIIATALHTFLDTNDEMISSEGTFVGFQVLAHAAGAPDRQAHSGAGDLAVRFREIAELRIGDPARLSAAVCANHELVPDHLRQRVAPSDESAGTAHLARAGLVAFAERDEG